MATDSGRVTQLPVSKHLHCSYYKGICCDGLDWMVTFFQEVVQMCKIAKVWGVIARWALLEKTPKFLT